MTQTKITIIVVLAFIGFLALCLIDSSFTDNNNGNTYLTILGIVSLGASLIMGIKGYIKQN